MGIPRAQCVWVRILSRYEVAVLEALRNGPRRRKDLVSAIVDVGIMSQRKLQKTLNELVDAEKIVRTQRREEGTHRTAIWYALPRHRHLLEVDFGELATAVKNLRVELCRNPDVEEIAARIGKDPDDTRRTVFEHAPELDWHPPTSEEKEEAKELCQKALGLAAEIKFSVEDEEEISKLSINVLENSVFLLGHRLETIKQENLPNKPIVLFPNSPSLPMPNERSKEQILEKMKEIAERIKGLRKAKLRTNAP